MSIVFQVTLTVPHCYLHRIIRSNGFRISKIGNVKTKLVSAEKSRKVRRTYDQTIRKGGKEINESALTFTVGAALALETASSAAGQGSAVISVKFVRFDFQLFGLAGASSRICMPSVIRMQETELRTSAVALCIVAVTSFAQFGLSQ